MEDDEKLWKMINDTTFELNRLIHMAVGHHGLKIEVEVDNNMRTIDLRFPVPRVEVKVFKEFRQ